MLKSRKRLLIEKYKCDEPDSKPENDHLLFNNINKLISHYETKQIIILIEKFLKTIKIVPIRINNDDDQRFFGNEPNINRRVRSYAYNIDILLNSSNNLETYIIENLSPKVPLNNLCIDIYKVQQERKVKIVVSYNLKTEMDSFLFNVYLKYVDLARNIYEMDYEIL